MSNGAMVGTMDSAPSSEPTMDVIHGQTQQTRETMQETSNVLSRIEDHLNGARPEKENAGAVESVPAGVLAQVCATGTINNEMATGNLRRLVRIGQQLGVAT